MENHLPYADRPDIFQIYYKEPTLAGFDWAKKTMRQFIISRLYEHYIINGAEIGRFDLGLSYWPTKILKDLVLEVYTNKLLFKKKGADSVDFQIFRILF